MASARRRGERSEDGEIFPAFQATLTLGNKGELAGSLLLNIPWSSLMSLGRRVLPY